MTPPEILIFDSGVGGLSVALDIHRRIPSAGLTYLADNACFPYGELSESQVTSRCVQLVGEVLARQPVDLIVIACNTASTTVLPKLRSVVSVPVVGVVPAIKPAAMVSESRRIGLLATPATVKRVYLDHLVAEFAADCTLKRVGDPELVRWIEAWVAGEALPEHHLNLALEPLRVAQVDTVILGCTHYPLIADTLKALLPEVRFWVDSGDAIARRTAFLLSEAGFDVSRRSVGTHPFGAVRFSGEVPTGIEIYLKKIGLVPRKVQGHWPVNPVVTTVGSA